MTVSRTRGGRFPLDRRGSGAAGYGNNWTNWVGVLDLADVTDHLLGEADRGTGLSTSWMHGGRTRRPAVVSTPHPTAPDAGVGRPLCHCARASRLPGVHVRLHSA